MKASIAARSRTSSMLEADRRVGGVALAAYELRCDVPVAMTSAPSRAKPCAMARPMPLVAPETSTRLAGERSVPEGSNDLVHSVVLLDCVHQSV